MDFEVKGFCAENLEEKIHKRYLKGIPFLPHGQLRGRAEDLLSACATLGSGTLPKGGAVIPVSEPTMS